MPPLPVLSGRQLVRVLEGHGWQVNRQVGSHIIMVKAGTHATISVPDHREIAKGTLRAILRAADLSVDDLIGAA